VRPTFSVLVAAYNAESTLGEALDSLIAQTLREWQAVVVDDGSSDATFTIARDYAARDARITALTQPNGGTASARNLAAASASAPWLLALDADDMLLPEALERQAAFMSENPGFDIYSWALLLQAPDGSRALWPVNRRHSRVESYTLEQLVGANIIPAGSVTAAELFGSLGGYRSVFLEDYDLWLRALASGAHHLHNPEPLAVYRVSLSSKNVDLVQRTNGAERILSDLADSSSISSAQRALAREAARRHRAIGVRQRLESQLDAGDCSKIRVRYLKARRAYPNALRWLAGAALIVVSPRLFAKIAPRARIDVANIETPEGMSLGDAWDAGCGDSHS